MKKSKFMNLFIISMLIITALYTLIVYKDLPNQIPTHWNFKGQIDGYSDKYFTFITLFIPIGIYFLFPFIRSIDPKKDNYMKYEKAYKILQVSITMLMIILHWVTLFAAQGYKVDVGTIIPFLIGVMFVIIGNYLTTVKQSFFVGFRTPWTLSNEVVWNKTHRLGGYYFVLMGFMFMIISLFRIEWLFLFLIGFLFLGVIGLTIYSYVLFKKLEKK